VETRVLGENHGARREGGKNVSHSSRRFPLERDRGKRRKVPHHDGEGTTKRVSRDEAPKGQKDVPSRKRGGSSTLVGNLPLGKTEWGVVVGLSFLKE